MTETLLGLLLERARERGDHVALREKELGIWRSLTWKEYESRVRNFSLGLLALGFERGEKVAILGDNRPEWVIGELGSIAAGGIVMGVYQDCVAAEVQFLVDFADVSFLIAEDQEQVDKYLEQREGLPKVRRVIYYDPRGLRGYEEEMLIEFCAVEKRGEEYGREHPDLFERSVQQLRPSDTALLATTSGTTGKPKLAMLSHENLITMARNFHAVDPADANDDFLSLLPLPWIGEQMLSIAFALVAGFAVNFPEEPETIPENLVEIGPHMMFSPPRIWENMVSEVQVKVEDASWLKRKVYDWAMGVGYAVADARLTDEKISKVLVLKKLIAEWTCLLWVKDKMGLRRIKHAYTGGAALGPDILRFYHALGVNLKQAYGQTEVAGLSMLHRDGDIKFQTVGLALPETEVKVAEDGEILTRGRSVFQGYYNNPEATEETLKDGWLHSGDAGYFDDDGHLVVIDRAKDVMTLHDGTRFSPQFIENKLKFSPYVKEAVVFGGDWPFVTAMISIDYGNAGKWAEKRQIPYTTYTDLAQKPEIYELVKAHVEKTNEDLPGAAKISRFLLLHKELDADDAELTRTRKVRRGFIAERYEVIVSALYSDQDTVAVETEISYQDGRTAITRTDLAVETLTI